MAANRKGPEQRFYCCSFICLHKAKRLGCKRVTVNLQQNKSSGLLGGLGLVRSDDQQHQQLQLGCNLQESISSMNHSLVFIYSSIRFYRKFLKLQDSPHHIRLILDAYKVIHMCLKIHPLLCQSGCTDG